MTLCWGFLEELSRFDPAVVEKPVLVLAGFEGVSTECLIRMPSDSFFRESKSFGIWFLLFYLKVV